MSQTPIFHGSDLEQIASYYHIESDEICCFSANVNPLGFPEQTALAVCKNFSHLMSRYPDRNYIGLRAAIGATVIFLRIMCRWEMVLPS